MWDEFVQNFHLCLMKYPEYSKFLSCLMHCNEPLHYIDLYFVLIGSISPRWIIVQKRVQMHDEFLPTRARQLGKNGAGAGSSIRGFGGVGSTWNIRRKGNGTYVYLPRTARGGHEGEIQDCLFRMQGRDKRGK